MNKTVNLDDADFAPGNPEELIVGKDEKAATKHGQQPPKPIKSAKTILTEMQFHADELRQRLAELEALQTELKTLELAIKALQNDA